MTHQTHKRAMHYALRLATRGLGRTAPNPTVGCVITKNHQILGIGITERGGRPHAETQALAMAGGDAKGATMYVTLEPCSHTGQTPPCCEAIVKAGIAECYIACQDPNPQVNGQGIAYLKEHGVQTHVGLCEADALALNEGFFLTQTANRPWVTLKIATTSDHQMITPQTDAPDITGAKARMHGHQLRANHDAILTGIGTVLADDPMLTCRIQGREQDSPIRIVLDRQLQIPPSAALIQSANDVPVWIFTEANDKAEALTKAGAHIHTIKPNADWPAILSAIAEQGITRLLVEAGPTIAKALLNAGLVDELHWYQAPHALGNNEHKAQGKPDLPLAQIESKPLITRILIGSDQLSVYRLSPCLQASSQI